MFKQMWVDALEILSINTFHLKIDITNYSTKNTIKLSYSCMPNMANMVNKHNARLLREKDQMIEAVIVEIGIAVH